MVGDTCRADARGLGPPRQKPDSLLRTETGVEGDGASLRGAVLGVPGGRRCPRGPCRPPWLWDLRWLETEGHKGDKGHKGMGAEAYYLRMPPTLTRARIRAAYGVAAVTDALQIVGGPVGWAFVDEALDVVA